MLKKKGLVAFLLLSYRCLVPVSVKCLFLTASWVGLQCVIVVVPGNTHLLLGRLIYITVQIDQLLCVNC